METIALMLLMFGAMYFVLIRPESKRKKAAITLRDSLVIGDEVTTIGGIVGTICAVKETTIVIESGADRVRIELLKWAISTKGAQTTETTK